MSIFRFSGVEIGAHGKSLSQCYRLMDTREANICISMSALFHHFYTNDSFKTSLGRRPSFFIYKFYYLAYRSIYLI
jgi:hypothetical protein